MVSLCSARAENDFIVKCSSVSVRFSCLLLNGGVSLMAAAAAARPGLVHPPGAHRIGRFISGARSQVDQPLHLPSNDLASASEVDNPNCPVLAWEDCSDHCQRPLLGVCQ